MMKEFAKNLVLQWIFGTLYFFGLTFLLAFLLTKSIPAQLGMFKSAHQVLLVVSISMVIIGLFGMLYSKHDFTKTLSALGRATLVPGLLGVIISITGKDIVIKMVERSINIKPIKELLILSLDKASSQVWMLTLSYIVIGISLYIVSKKMD